MARTCSVLFVLALFACISMGYVGSFVEAAKRTVNIGVLLTETGADAGVGAITKKVMQLAEERLAASPSSYLSGKALTDLDIVFKYADCTSVITSCRTVTEQMMSGTLGYNVDIVLAPYGSTLLNGIADIADLKEKYLISGGATADDIYKCMDTTSTGCANKQIGELRFKYLWSVSSPASEYFNGFTSLTWLNRVKTVTLMKEKGNSVFTNRVCTGVKDSMQSFDIKVLKEVEFTRGNVAETLAATEQARQANADALVGCVSSSSCPLIIQNAKDMNWLPKATGFTTCVGKSLVTAVSNNADALYFTGPAEWDPDLRGRYTYEKSSSLIHLFPTDVPCPTELAASTSFSSRNYPSSINLTTTCPLPSSELFSIAFAKKYPGEHMTYQGAAALAPLYAAISALAKITDPTNVPQSKTEMDAALEFMDLSTFYGRIFFNKFHENSAKGVLNLQVISTTQTNINAPLESAEDTMLYPMPLWTDRTFTWTVAGLGPEQVVVAIICVELVIILSITGLTLYHREEPSIKSAGVEFLVEMLLGSMIMCFGNLVWLLNMNEAMCIARPWLLSVGFTLFTGTLISKSIRILNMFSSTNLDDIRKQTSASVQMRIMVMLLPMVILPLLQSVIQDHTPTVVTTDPYRPGSTSNSVCTATDSSMILSIIMLAGALVMILYLIYLVYALRNVPPQFNEGKAIVNSAYSLVLAFGIAVIITVSGASTGSQGQATFFIRSVALMMMSLLPPLTIFVPKLLDLDTLASPDDENYKPSHLATRKSQSLESEGESQAHVPQLTTTTGHAAESRESLTAEIAPVVALDATRRRSPIFGQKKNSTQGRSSISLATVPKPAAASVEIQALSAPTAEQPVEIGEGQGERDVDAVNITVAQE